MGLMAAVATTTISAKAQHSVTVQADQFRRDISHLQMLAISQSRRLKLTVSATGYAVCAAATATCNAAGAISDPMTGQAFSVTLADGVQFTGGTGNYWFDSMGRPATAASGVALAGAVTNFTLNGVGRATAVTVAVTPVTGFARTTYCHGVSEYQRGPPAGHATCPGVRRARARAAA